MRSKSGRMAILLFFLMEFHSLFAVPEISIEGFLYEKGTKKPLVGVAVYFLPKKLKAITDSTGYFIMRGTNSGECEWVIHLPGYQSLRRLDEIEEKSASVRTFYLKRLNSGVFETTIYGKIDKRDNAVKTLTSEQFEAMPGAGGDPLKAVKNLPGMNRAPYLSAAIIQGSAPKDTRYMINGHEVPLSYHLLANSSVLLSEAVERVDFFSAGYGPTYGRAMGGVIGLWSKPPRSDRLHGLGFVDLYNAGAILEGPVGSKSAFFLGARRSYVDFLMKLLYSKRDDLDFTVAPNFSDFNAIYETELTPIDQFHLLSIGSIDTLEFIRKNSSPSISLARGEYYFRKAFLRLIPQVTHRHSSRTTSRWSIGLGRDWDHFQVQDSRYYQLSTSFSTRIEVERKFLESWDSTWGIDHRYTNSKNELGGSSFLGGRETFFHYNQWYGVYWLNNIHQKPSPWTWKPGARLDHFSPQQNLLFQPRLASRYTMDETLALRLGGGLYYQPPQDYEVDSYSGNPELKAPRSWHLALGIEKDFRAESTKGFQVSSGSFYRFFDQLIVPSSALVLRNGYLTPEIYNNSGRGRAFGLENSIKYELYPWQSSLSYTLSRSTRWDPGHPENFFQYDQTHNLNWIFSVELPRDWKISTRFRYVTGNPFTPIRGSIFDSDGGDYLPIYGPRYSQRLDPFLQLDLRIDKKWIYDTYILSGYLDILNVTNRENVEQVRYSYDYSQTAKMSGIPILPTLGVRVEF